MGKNLKGRESPRADRRLKELFPALTGSQIDEAFEEGLVLGPDGKRIKKGDRVLQFDTRLLKERIDKLRAGNPSLSFEVVFDAEDFVVIDKPAGIAGHPLGLSQMDTVTHWAFAKYPKTLEEFPGVQPELTPHRLDVGTSGCQVVCLTSASYLLWRERFDKKKVSKKYLAWVWGRPKENEFEVNYAVAHSRKDRGKMVAPALGHDFIGDAREAQSIIRVLKCVGDKSFVEVSCHSGVTHQVRVHLASVGLPLVGDALYDDKWNERALRPEYHALRASQLGWDAHLASVSTAEFEKAPPS